MCKERYINPFTDFGFKRLFGTEANKDILIHFLNSILEDEDEDEIVDITYLNPEKIGIRPSDRRSIFDIYCKTTHGHFIVEMQNSRQKHFIDRSIYYSSLAVEDMAKKGDWDFELTRIYTVAILNFHADEFKGEPGFKQIGCICNKYSGKVISNKQTYVFLEMKKFDKTLDELETLTDKWMYVIKNMYLLEAYPSTIKETIFKKLFTESKIAAFSDEDRLAYEESLKVLRDNQNILNTAIEEGIEKGISIGEERGEHRSKIETAIKMKADNMSSDIIAKYTGLSVEEIEKLDPTAPSDSI